MRLGIIQKSVSLVGNEFNTARISPHEQFQLDNYCGVCVFSPPHAEERRMWDVKRGGLNEKKKMEKRMEKMRQTGSQCLQTDTLDEGES